MTRMTNFVRVTVLLSVSCFTRTHGNLLTVPKNTVAKLQDRVVFECSTSETSDEWGSLEWTFFSATSKNKSIIYETGVITQTCSSKYAVENSIPRRYNLIMDSVDLSFGGTYTCTWSETEEETQGSSAELIVIASNPVCSTNESDVIKDSDYIQMWCTVNYSGNWNPVMEWTTGNGQNVETNITYTSTANTATSVLPTQINSANKEVTFTCKTSFAPTATNICMTQRPGKVCANNTPKYQHLWKYTTYVSLDSDETSPDNDLVVILWICLSVGAVVVFIVIAIIICKLRKRENRESCRETSVQEHDYEMVDEMNTTSGDFGNPVQNQRTSTEARVEHHELESIAYDGYSSLKPYSPTTQLDVYTLLHLYANTNMDDS